jgi:hypothetical protein
MSPKFFYLYLVGGTAALALALYELLTAYPAVNTAAALIYFVPVILLYYMAYKVYHVKKDSELM